MSNWTSETVPWNDYKANINSVVFTGAITSIGDFAFYDCTRLTSITIPNSVTSIGKTAFYNCQSLTSITIPDSVTSIGDNAFKVCSGLTSITIPNSVTSIGVAVFNGCSRLTSITIPNSVTSIGKSAFQTSGLKNITIPDSVTSIGDSAFENCSSLESVTIPNSVISIGLMAFEGCSNLTSITIPDSVTSIGDGAFSHTGLTSITIPDGVTSIADGAFSFNSKLTSITIPSSVTSIGSFRQCPKLKDVYYSGTKTDWNNIKKNSNNDALIYATIHSKNAIFANCGNNFSWEYEHEAEILTISGSGEMSNWTSTTVPWEDYKANIRSVVFTGKITSIGSYAFYDCSALESITIPVSTTSISNDAFYLCPRLTKVYYSGKQSDWNNISIGTNNDALINATIYYKCGDNLYFVFADGTLTITGSGEMSNWTTAATVPWKDYTANISSVVFTGDITSIGSCAFYNCSSLKSITIPDSVTSIGGSAFSGCTSLTSITIPNSVTSIGSFSRCTNLTSITIPNSVTSIGGSAFEYCSSLESITIPDSVTSIGDYAFRGCSGLTSITIPDSVTSIGSYAFYDCSGLESITILGSVTSIGQSAFYGCTDLTSITIPNSVTSIGQSAFYGCTGLTSITIPNSVTSIGQSAFCGCTGLTSITIPNSVTSIDDYAFQGCSGLTSITIPDSVTSIGQGAFYGCSGLTSITIPDSVTSIGQSAFSGCTDLTSITIPNSVTSIGQMAFEGCSNLTSITIPNSVTSIDDRAYRNCSSLTRIIIPDRVSSIGRMAFEGCLSLASITIPNSVTKISQEAFGGCSGLKDVYYSGTKTDWDKIIINSNNNALNSATIHYKCGENLMWSYKASTLTISGSGEMSNWTAATVPWKNYTANIRSVVITGDITSIGSCAFYNCSSLKSITIPDSVSSIGDYAFKGCSGLKDIYYGGSETDWNKISFGAYNTPLVNANIHYAFWEITVSDTVNGTATVSKNIASVGDEITVTATPDDGYVLDCIKVNDVAIEGFKFTMGEEKTIVSVTFKKIEYNITVNETTNGTASVDKTKAGEGDKITVTVKPAEGYELDSIKVNDTAIDGLTFIMGVGDTVVDVTFKKTPYLITVSKTVNGTATVDKEKACAGDTVNVTATPDACYELDAITVNGEAQTGTSFTMPDGNAMVVVTFKVKAHQLTPVAEKPATCEEDGYEAHYKCTECNKIFSDADGKNEISAPKVIKKFGHSWDDGVVTKEPTCEEEGVKTFHCTHDGCTATKTEAIKAVGHSWDEGEVTKEPSCVEAGVKTFHCTHDGCTETKTETVKALGHKIVTVAEKAPTKTEPGNIKHYKCEKCGKLFSDADGKNEITQAQTVIPAMGHDLTEVKAVAATCTEPGNIAYYICKDDDCKCGKAYSDAYGQHEIDIQDTVKPALGHNPVETVGKDPTCTEDGYEKYYKCSRCHKFFSDAEGKNEIEKPVAISKLGHDMKRVEAKKPTHEDDGHREYYHCNRCGKNFADAEGTKTLTDAEIVVPHIGAAILDEEITEGDFIYKVTNPRTDGTGTVTLIGVANETETVVIPATVELKLDTYKVNRIGPKAFYNDKMIKTLNIGANVVIIDSSAFYGCAYLTKVSGGKALQTINASAFAYCTRLKTFSIASPILKKIGPNTFYKDKSLKTIYIQKTTKITKAGVKKSLKGSSVKTVKVKKSKVKKYKKYFKKSNSGRKVKVKK